MTRIPLISEVLILFLFIFSCDSKRDLKAHKKNALDEKQAVETTSAQDVKADEIITPPSNIIGTFLNCRHVSIPVDNADAQAIGCNFYDNNTSARVEIKTFASNIDWDYDSKALPSNTKVTIYKPKPEQNQPYEV